MTETDAQQPAIPPPPAQEHPPVIEEPGRLKLVVVFFWLFAASYAVGCMGCMATAVMMAPLLLPMLGMTLYHGGVAWFYGRTALMLQRRRRPRPHPLGVFLGTIFLQVLWPVAVGVACVLMSQGNIFSLFPAVNMAAIAIIPMLLYVILGIVALVQLRRPGVRALLG